MSQIGLIILAAGASTRLSQPKQLLPYRGAPLLRHVAQIALASSCRPIAIVLGAQTSQVRPTVGDLPLQIVENSDWPSGPGSSIRAGVAALRKGCDCLDAIIILLCDQPLVTTQHIDRLAQTHAQSGKPIVATEYAGTAGVPVLFDKSLFAELAALDPAHGAKPLLVRHAADLALVSFPDATVDIDTLADYELLVDDPLG